MADPLRILPFGGCQLGFGMRALISSGRAILTTSEAELNSSRYTMSEILQAIRFVRGDVEVPAHLRYFCNFPKDAVPGSDRLRRMEQADVVLLEPNTTLDVFFGPYVLHRSNLLTGFINPLSEASDELREAAAAWFNQGLFGQNHAVQRDAARVLIPALGGRVADADVARRILLEAKVEEQSFARYLATVGEVCEMLEAPVGLVTFVYSYLPDGRPIGWPADFVENTLKLANILMLPMFDSAAMVARFGVDVCLDDDRKLYREEFWPVLSDQLFEFARNLRETGTERLAGKRLRTLALVNNWSAEVPDAVLPLRGVNCFGDVRDVRSSPWGTVGAHWERKADRGPGGIFAFKLREDAVRRSHDFRRIVTKPSRREDYALSFMAKPDERSRIDVWIGSQSLADRAQFSLDLEFGQVVRVGWQGAGWKPLDAGLVSLEDGWWWCWLAVRSDDSESLQVLVALAIEEGELDYEGDGASGAWFGHVRLEKGQVPTLAAPPPAPTPMGRVLTRLKRSLHLR